MLVYHILHITHSSSNAIKVNMIKTHINHISCIVGKIYTYTIMKIYDLWSGNISHLLVLVLTSNLIVKCLNWFHHLVSSIDHVF